MRKAFFTIAAAAALLSACANKQIAAPAAAQPRAQTSGDTKSVASTSQQSTQKAAPAPAADKPADQAASAQTANANSAAAEIKKDYHMNKNYDIVPNDPNANKRVVLLTFDDGPKDKDMINALFDALDKHKAKAIFFMNGYRIKAHPELLKLINERGGILGNHSWDHIDLKKETNAKIDQQVDDVTKIMKEQTGKTPQFFRPPFGSGNDYLKEKVKNEGMLYMTWSNGSLDWEMTNKNNDPNKVIANVIKQLHFGSNILMHELPWTTQALDKLLTQLEEKGYTFVDPRTIELAMR